MIRQLEEKIALVTGASSGIGQATALELAAAGAAVAVSARRENRLVELVSQIEARGGRAIALPGDVAEEAAAERAVMDTVEQLGGLDILVNSAGIIQAGSVQHAKTEEWRRVMEVNFFGTFYTCKTAIAPMLARGGGDIINISSTSGRRAAALFGAYSPSKFAVNSFSEGMRQELGASGIRVCVIELGATESEVAENINDPEWREKMRMHVTKEGAMKAKDIADAILFVVSLPPRANVSELLIRPTIDVAPM